MEFSLSLLGRVCFSVLGSAASSLLYYPGSHCLRGGPAHRPCLTVTQGAASCPAAGGTEPPPVTPPFLRFGLSTLFVPQVLSGGARL